MPFAAAMQHNRGAAFRRRVAERDRHLRPEIPQSCRRPALSARRRAPRRVSPSPRHQQATPAKWEVIEKKSFFESHIAYSRKGILLSSADTGLRRPPPGHYKTRIAMPDHATTLRTAPHPTASPAARRNGGPAHPTPPCMLCTHAASLRCRRVAGPVPTPRHHQATA